MKTDQKTPEMMRAFYSRVTPILPELFNMAHAICGNYDLAEYALQCALLEVWFGEAHAGIGLKENLRTAVRRFSTAELTENHVAEITWNELENVGDDLMLETLALESTEVRRIAALKYGCGLSASKIARLMNTSTGSIHDALLRLEKRIRRRSGISARRYEAEMTASIRSEFKHSENMPAPGAIYRAFAAEASQVHRTNVWFSKLLKRIAALLLALLCAFVFWLAAALIQPIELDSSSNNASEIAEYREN